MADSASYAIAHWTKENGVKLGDTYQFKKTLDDGRDLEMNFYNNTDLDNVSEHCALEISLTGYLLKNHGLSEKPTIYQQTHGIAYLNRSSEEFLDDIIELMWEHERSIDNHKNFVECS